MEDFRSVEDMVIDPAFRKWVLEDDARAREQWLNYLAANPEKKQMAEDAREVLLGMTGLRYSMSRDAYERTLENILNTTDPSSQDIHSLKQDATPKVMRYGYAVAAAIGGILMVAAAWWLFLSQPSLQTYQTAYGETEIIRLPDSSTVTLNANSSIYFDKDHFLERREVHVEGEAYFNISKSVNQEGITKSFEVLTKDVEVRVLGTRFNVNTRRQNTSVVLEEGSVSLELTQLDKPKLRMQPGEMVTYDQESNNLEKEVVNPALHLAWKDNKLIYADTPVLKIIQGLEDNYGLQVELQNEEVASRRYTGTFEDPDPEFILLSLKTLYGLKQENKDGKIILK